MKILSALALSTLLALSAVAFMPTAAADTCSVSDPDVEDAVCTPVMAAYCVAMSAPDYKNVRNNLVRCMTVLY